MQIWHSQFFYPQITFYPSQFAVQSSQLVNIFPPKYYFGAVVGMTSHLHVQLLQGLKYQTDALWYQMSSPYAHCLLLQCYLKLLHCCDCLPAPVTMEMTMDHMICITWVKSYWKEMNARATIWDSTVNLLYFTQNNFSQKLSDY